MPIYHNRQNLQAFGERSGGKLSGFFGHVSVSHFSTMPYGNASGGRKPTLDPKDTVRKGGQMGGNATNRQVFLLREDCPY